MDYKDVEALLERYWQCDTSIEEEAALRDFFLHEEVPAQWMCYKDLFVYQHRQQSLGLGSDFDARVLSQVEPAVVKAKRLTWMGRCFPLFKAAAVVLIFLLLGNVAQHFFTVGDESVLQTDTISEEVNVPSVAISNEGNVECALVDTLMKMNGQVQIVKK